jgi:hypothetical protein
MFKWLSKRPSPQPATWKLEVSSDFMDVALPEGLPIVPAMTNPREWRYFYWLARQFRGEGAAIEIGPWLGASTVAFAAGIRDSESPAKRKRVQVFDHFRWRAGGWDAKRSTAYAEGDSFLGEFTANLGPLLNYVDVHQLPIRDFAWDRGPVELIILDAPKRVPDISRVLRAFAQHTLPGKTIMVWQDFSHYASYTVPACLSRLGLKIEPVHRVNRAPSIGFRVREQWSPSDVSEEALDLAKWTPEEIRDAWNFWQTFVYSSKSIMFAQGEALFLYDIGEPELARKRLHEILSSATEEQGSLIVRAWNQPGRVQLRDRYRPLYDEVSAFSHQRG